MKFRFGFEKKWAAFKFAFHHLWGVFFVPEDVLVLSHQSLMTFASFVNQQLIEQIAIKLGLHKSTINKIKTNVIDEVSKLNEPIVLQNFKMLWSWRGRKSTSRMVDQLLNVLRGINRWELAAVVSTAHKEQRRMRMTDFMWSLAPIGTLDWTIWKKKNAHDRFYVISESMQLEC